MVPGSWGKTFALRAVPEHPVSIAPEPPPVKGAEDVKGVQVAELERAGEQDSGSPTGLNTCTSAKKGKGLRH